MMEKLECLKEISKLLSELEETKLKLKQSIRENQDGEKVMQLFLKEKEFLLSEREELSECLKQIDGDLNNMDSLLNQTESDKYRNIESYSKLVNEYKQRRSLINKLRSHILLPNLDNDNFLENLDILNKNTSDWPQNNLQLTNNSTLSLLNKNNITNVSKNSQLNFGHHSEIPSQIVERKIERTMSSSFCQQPPPMKICSFCNQQIHRNAPICPYCKAKSRSRNPKKPKRKIEN